MRQLTTIGEVAKTVLVAPHEEALDVAERIVRRWGVPVFAHRGPEDGCPRDCYGGWPDQSCHPGLGQE